MNLQEKKIFILVGMSGSGKTTLAQKLSKDGAFHYSVDYEIAHTHLKEKIKQSIIEKISNQSKIFQDLYEKHLIKLDLSLTFDDLSVITSFVIPENSNGKILLKEFLKNQEFYKKAEIKATMEFESRAQIAFQNYHSKSFIVDTTGSICQVALSNENLLNSIKSNSTVVFFKTTNEHKNILIDRSKTTIKPILYDVDFLFENLRIFYNTQNFTEDFEIDKEFFLWIFPVLLEYRSNLYNEFVRKTNGVIVDVSIIESIQSYKDFLEIF